MPLNRRRDRVAQRLPALDTGSRFESHYQGMYTFGRKELGD